MSKIYFRVISIEFNKTTLQKINKNNLVRLNLTQKPTRIAEEYLLNNINSIKNINHEFVIDDHLNKVEKLSMTIRSVVKKITFANIFNLDDDTNKMKKSNDHSIDRFIQGYKENRYNNVVCEYIEPKLSLIGYCTIDMKEIGRGINNTLHAEIHSRINDQVIGYANLQIYIWNSYPKVEYVQKREPICNQSILFVDPGCPPLFA